MGRSQLRTGPLTRSRVRPSLGPKRVGGLATDPPLARVSLARTLEFWSNLGVHPRGRGVTDRVGAILAVMIAAGPCALAADVAAGEAGGLASDQQSAQSADYAGYYQLGPHAVLTISQQGGRWYARLTGQRRIELMSTSTGAFNTVGVAAEITFQVGAGSKVTSLILRQNGREITAAKIDEMAAMAADPTIADSRVPRTWKQRFVGAPRLVATGDHGSDYWPCFSPDGGTLLFAHTVDGRTWSLMRAALTGGPAKTVAIAGAPGSETRPSWSASAKLIAFTGATDQHDQVWVMQPDGTGARAVLAPGLSDRALYPSWYPDGRHLAAMDAGDFVIRRFDLAGGPAVAITDHAKVLAGMPSVSPDGKWIAFAGQKNLGQAYDQNRNVIWLAGADGELRTLEAKPLQGRAPAWSPDGSHLAFESDRGSPDGRYAAFVIAKDGTDLTQITPYELNVTHPVWSPDGRHMALVVQSGTATRIGIVDLPSLH